MLHTPCPLGCPARLRICSGDIGAESRWAVGTRWLVRLRLQTPNWRGTGRCVVQVWRRVRGVSGWGWFTLDGALEVETCACLERGFYLLGLVVCGTAGVRLEDFVYDGDV